MTFTDTHTHIYAAEFDNDLDSVVTRATENSVTHLFLPAIDAEYHEKLLKVTNRFSAVCHPMMGLHPTSVKEDFQKELSIVEEYLSNNAHRFYAIGEIGIDLYWDKTFALEQQLAFNHQLDLAIRYNLPVIIHTRNSMDIALEILERRSDQRLRGIFHCFSGNYAQAIRAINLGFMLGIGGVITYKNSGLQHVVEKASLDNLVLETDAPWLPPVPHRGQRNEPSYIPVIAGKIAEIKRLTMEEVASVTTANATRLFGI